jgi:hypothetical protein
MENLLLGLIGIGAGIAWIMYAFWTMRRAQMCRLLLETYVEETEREETKHD